EHPEGLHPRQRDQTAVRAREHVGSHRRVGADPAVRLSRPGRTGRSSRASSSRAGSSRARAEAMSRLLTMAAVDGPAPPDFHLFETESGHHALVVKGSRVYSMSASAAGTLASAADPRLALAALGLDAPAYVTDEPLRDPPVRALSLAIAQRCNLGCSYCY